MSSGYVYILSNPSMPGLLKIGRSIKGGSSRGASLYKTGVAAPFSLVFEVYSIYHEILEQEVHKALSWARVESGREFFRLDEKEAIESIIGVYLATILDSDSRLIEPFLYDGAVDLLALSHDINMPPADVFNCVIHIEKDAVEKAHAEFIEKERARIIKRDCDKGFLL